MLRTAAKSPMVGAKKFLMMLAVRLVVLRLLIPAMRMVSKKIVESMLLMLIHPKLIMEKPMSPRMAVNTRMLQVRGVMLALRTAPMLPMTAVDTRMLSLREMMVALATARIL